MLELRNVHGGYGKITILNGVSFRIPKASITTMIGPNGAGKSTVFKAIFGPQCGAATFGLSQPRARWDHRI
jgi:branched-chain amino acid transport system ATP-binding protein